MQDRAGRSTKTSCNARPHHTFASSAAAPQRAFLGECKAELARRPSDACSGFREAPGGVRVKDDAPAIGLGLIHLFFPDYQ